MFVITDIRLTIFFIYVGLILLTTEHFLRINLATEINFIAVFSIWGDVKLL